MGRTKELKQAPAEMAEILPAKVTAIEAAQEANALVVQQQAQEDQLQLLELASDVGALRALELTRSLVAAATIRVFQKVCDSKRIKDLPIRAADGSVATATNLDDFCRIAFGRPRSAMFEASASLEALGEQAYEAASRLGLNRSALRAARALPPEKLEAVRLAIGSGGTKAEVLSVIEDLAEKAEQAEAATADVRKEWEADKDLLATKNKTIDRLQREIRRIEKLPADDKLALLKKEATAIATEAEVAVLGGLRQALIALANHGEESGLHLVFMAGLVGQVQAQLNALRQEFSLLDIGDAEKLRLAAEMAEWDKE